MDKFSLYDLLGLLLPGIFLVWLIHLLNALFQFFSFSILPVTWDLNLWLLLCFALVAGAMLYVLNFWLVEKTRFYPRLTGLYKPVSELYLKRNAQHQFMNDRLNKQAVNWYQQEIFFSLTVFKDLQEDVQHQLKVLQNEFYDRMYYELEYHGKLEQAKTFQSFYFFFRQLFSAGLLVLMFAVSMVALCHLFPSIYLRCPPVSELLVVGGGLLVILLLSVSLAQWYRKRMVQKMYWAYFSHLNQTQNL